MPFFRQRPQRLGEQLECLGFYCRFAAFGDKTCSFHANEIANVQQTKKLEQFRTNLPCVDVDLNSARDVTQVEKVAFAHVAMRGDAAGDTSDFIFFKLLAHLRDRAANIKGGAEWFDASRAQRLKFFSSERDQLVFVFHIRTANVRRDTCFATSNREVVFEVLALTLQTNILGLPTKHLQ
ncbi:MAG: hypothetical protein Udaeo_14120 [Candidatus Udaeobacter sp.]|nr:MAG: hypothetical protein Udaeo_14120 [Candidatus Udaeobacter sp.]